VKLQPMLFVLLCRSVPRTMFVMPRYGRRKRELPVLGFPGLPIYHDRGGPIRQDFSKLRRQRDSVFLPTSFDPSIHDGTTGGVTTPVLTAGVVSIDQFRSATPAPEAARSHDFPGFWLDGISMQLVPRNPELGPNRLQRAILSGMTFPPEIQERPPARWYTTVRTKGIPRDLGPKRAPHVRWSLPLFRQAMSWDSGWCDEAQNGRAWP
jgi:hypothetical protein